MLSVRVIENQREQLAPPHKQGDLGSTVSSISRVRGATPALNYFPIILTSSDGLFCYVIMQKSLNLVQSGLHQPSSPEWPQITLAGLKQETQFFSCNSPPLP